MRERQSPSLPSQEPAFPPRTPGRGWLRPEAWKPPHSRRMTMPAPATLPGPQRRSPPAGSVGLSPWPARMPTLRTGPHSAERVSARLPGLRHRPAPPAFGGIAPPRTGASWQPPHSPWRTRCPPDRRPAPAETAGPVRRRRRLVAREGAQPADCRSEAKIAPPHFQRVSAPGRGKDLSRGALAARSWRDRTASLPRSSAGMCAF